MALSFNPTIQDFAKLCKEAYKDIDKRQRIFNLNGINHIYNKSKSNELWCVYENISKILIGVHGADDIKLNIIAIEQFLDPNKSEPEIERFCELHTELLSDSRPKFIAAHSLGTWVVSSCEANNPNNHYSGILFGPYAPTNEGLRIENMAKNGKFKKIFYDNDFFATNLLNIDGLNNAFILTPGTIPLTFINGHSISNFSDSDLELLNMDISKVIPRSDDINIIKKGKIFGETIINIMSYNVKMLNPLIFDLKSDKRAAIIPNEIMKQYPDIEIVIIQELFDDGAEKIFDKNMRNNGFFASKKVGSNALGGFNVNFKDLKNIKLDDGGIKIYSKLPIINENQTVFKNSNKEDNIAGKGAVRIGVMKNNILINIIGTHLQSGKIDLSNENKVKQFSQISKKLKQSDITILGGDFNLDKTTQSDLIDNILDNNRLNKFDYGPGTSTTDSDFSKMGKKWLDHFFYVDNDDFTISGIINISPLKIKNGFRKKKKERVNFIKKGKKKFNNLFRNKKQRKRKRRMEEKLVFDLSDHHPITISVNIKQIK